MNVDVFFPLVLRLFDHICIILFFCHHAACGGVLTDLEQTVMSPNYPSNYPNSVTCVWSLNIGKSFQLEFEAFHTDPGYDLLRAYSSLSSFTRK